MFWDPFSSLLAPFRVPMLPQVSKMELSKDSRKTASKTMCPIYQKCSNVVPNGSLIGVRPGAPKWALGLCGPSWGHMGSNGADWGAFLMSKRCTLDWFSILSGLVWCTTHFQYPVLIIQYTLQVPRTFLYSGRPRGDFQRRATGGAEDTFT